MCKCIFTFRAFILCFLANSFNSKTISPFFNISKNFISGNSLLFAFLWALCKNKFLYFKCSIAAHLACAYYFCKYLLASTLFNCDIIYSFLSISKYACTSLLDYCMPYFFTTSNLCNIFA